MVDLTDNDIRFLGNFPRFLRLKTLLCARNRISSIHPTFAATVPHLEVLVLTQNLIAELTDLEPLRDLKRLEILACTHTPAASNPYYRTWLIWRIKSLRILDYKKIKRKEREAAEELFGTFETPSPLASEILGIKSRTFDIATPSGMNGVGLGRITEDERKKIKLAIVNATSMAEVQKLEAMLLEGRIPDEKELRNRT